MKYMYTACLISDKYVKGSYSHLNDVFLHDIWAQLIEYTFWCNLKNQRRITSTPTTANVLMKLNLIEQVWR